MPREKTETVGITLRVREELRQSLEEAAKARKVSLNQEIIDRLEHVRGRLGLLPEVLALSYGREAAGLLMTIGLMMKAVGDTYHVRTRVADDGSRWTDNPIAIGNVAHAALALLQAAKPSDQVVNPDMGVKCALQLIGAVADPARKGWFTADHQSTEAIRSLLGPLVERMTNAVASRPVIGLAPATQQLQVEISAIVNVIADVFAILSQRYQGTPIPSRQEIFEAAEKRLSPAWEEMVRDTGRPFAVRVAPGMTSTGTIKIGKPVEVPVADKSNEQAGDQVESGTRKKRSK